MTESDRSRAAVETAERFADGLATEQELNRARSMACDAAHQAEMRGLRCRSGQPLQEQEQRLFFAGQAAHFHRPFLIGRLGWIGHDSILKRVSPVLLRDIFPNPFRARPAIVEGVLAWNDGCVVKLATGIYQDRDFSSERTAVLADALEEAGVTDAEVLEHLRGPGPHCRGCWAVDLLLSKE